jgi:ATP-binding cassette subfamily B protein
VILLVKDWKLALWSFTVLPFLVALTWVFRYFMRRAYREIRVKIARLYSHLQESISGMPVMQLFVRENVSAEEYVDINEDYRDANFLSIRYDAMLYAVVETVGSIAVGVIIWYGSGQVLQEAITLGVLVAFIEYMQKFFVPIRNLAQKYNQFQSAIASGERIFQLLDNDERLPEKAQPDALPDGPLRIEFDDVWFAYNEDEWILRGVSFEVDAGEKLALVGHTGAGKTTITSLLLRLYDVDRGAIRINGVDIRELDLDAYRRSFAVVLQDVFLFKGTIRENIALSDDQPLEEIIEAATTVRAHKLVQRYDDTYDHPVEERGGNLSAGEKQLIAFARALAHHPEFLILDEATANVDTETEALIQEAVEQLLAQQTSIAIAHRLSTIQNADRILVLHKGEVVESGSHDELVAMGGHYEKLYRLQYADPAAA